MASKTKSKKAATDSFADLKRRVSAKLTGFSSDFPSALDTWSMSSHRPDDKAFPVPELVLFTLRNIMGWRWMGHGEKERWAVLGSVAGNPVGFALRKFGFTILRGDPCDLDESRIVGQLHAALKVIEDVLEPFAKAQVDAGEVLVANHFAEFVNRYGYFRSQADAAFKRGIRKPRKRKPTAVEGMIGAFSDDINRSWQATREGFFNSTAMVDAYFSALEHRLILLRAFKGQALKPGEFREFLSLKWDQKLTAILPIKGHRRAELALGALRRIKERIRNPFAHGGVENDGGSLFVHIPHLGALPMSFSRYGDSVRFSFFPIEAKGHAETCAVFDEVDELLSTDALASPHKFVEASVDPSYDAATIKNYGKAVAGGDQQV